MQSPMLSEALNKHVTLTSGGFGHKDVMLLMRQEIHTLKSQVRDVSGTQESSRSIRIVLHSTVLPLFAAGIRMLLLKKNHHFPAVAKEYHSSSNKLAAELAEFKVREPFVQLLWSEVLHLRRVVSKATALGYTYDMDDPR